MTPPRNNTAERLDDYDEFDQYDEHAQEESELPEVESDQIDDADEFESAQDFDEAPESVNADHFENVDETDVDNFELDQDEIETARPSAHVAQQASAGGGRKATMIAGASLLVALAGVGVGGMAYMDAQQVRTDAGAAFESLTDSVGKLGDSTTQLQVAVSKMTDRVGANESAISGIDTGSIQERIVDVQRQLNTVALTVENDRALSADALNQIQSDIQAIQTDYQSQIANLKTAAAKPVAKPTSSAPKVAAAAKEKTVETVADARFVSADQWGYEQNIVLKTSTGSWEMIQIGDTYKGWRLMNVDPTKGTATFYDGKSFIKVNQTRG